jgi:type IV pilus assembly protein PilC
MLGNPYLHTNFLVHLGGKNLASYNYRAKTTAGEVVAGRFEANNENAVVALLRNKGYYPIDIRKIEGAEREVKLNKLKKVSTKDLAVFCRQFHTMMNAGVSILGCLDMLRKQTENKRLSSEITRVYDDVQKGKTLSESMKKHDKVFPVILTSLIEVGEVSGTIDSVLNRLAIHFDKENRVKQKIKTAMVYPAVIGCIAFLVVIFLLTFVVPKFVGMFTTMGAKLPALTQVVLNVSNTFANIWFLLTMTVVILLISYLFSKYRKTEKGKYVIDTIKFTLPLVGKNVKKIVASRFTRTLSALLSTGVPLIQALEVVNNVVDNQVVSKGMVRVKEDIKRGENLAAPLEKMGIFPVMVTQMISVGEEAGSLDSIMEKVADFYDEELDTSISRLIALLEPMMIMVVAVVVGIIVISMIMPIFGMYNALGNS